MGYQETWWTMYPYLGMETHTPAGDDLELYSESRVGTTAMTYQFASINDRPLWPKAGVIANAELGLRGLAVLPCRPLRSDVRGRNHRSSKIRINRTRTDGDRRRAVRGSCSRRAIPAKREFRETQHCRSLLPAHRRSSTAPLKSAPARCMPSNPKWSGL